MEESAKDVTQRILDRHIIYGASDDTNPAYASSNRSLNYATGGSIQSPEQEIVYLLFLIQLTIKIQLDCLARKITSFELMYQ